jgi:protein gp37
MSQNSTIEWTDATWNPVTGCTKISSGCRNCYAEKMSERLQAMGQANYKNGFELTLQPHMLERPLTWRKPKMIFVNSMSDLFHKDVPFEYIQKVFFVMYEAQQHIFQVLTKRSRRLKKLARYLPWPENVWMGVTVESKDYTNRIDNLCATDARVKFISFEPLLSPMPGLNLNGIDWVILGGESGPGSRPMKKEWVIDIRDRCNAADVPFFFKQWGGTNRKKAGRTLDGIIWDQMPDI